MRRVDITAALERVAFDFFYRFSRFEFALKENRYLKNEKPGKPADPNWSKFVKCWESKYELSEAAKKLIEARPKQQMVGPGEMDFVLVSFDRSASDLSKVVRLAKVVRNNLFHGGKHGAEGWDDPDRTLFLLSTSIVVLDELASLANLEAHYYQHY